MNNFNFYSPTYFEFGKNAEDKVANLIKRFGGNKVLLHYGGGSVKKSGLYDKIVNILNGSNINFIELGGVKPNPVDTLVYEGIELCKKEKIDFILAVGGGSVIDSAKAIAAGVCYDGDFWDFYAQDIPVTKAIPIGTVLTIAAAGSEGSGNSVITKVEGSYKLGAEGDALRPVFSILNPELTFTLPPFQTAAGCVDIMSHVMERYFSNTEGVEITDRLCEAVLKTMINTAPRAIAEPNNYDARSNIMWAGMVAHNNICGVGREQDWVTHHLEHELSAFFGVTHGAGLSVMTLAWMKFVMPKNMKKFLQFAVRVWDCEMNFDKPQVTAIEGVMKLEGFFSSLGMPIRFSDLGIAPGHIPMLAAHIGVKEERNYGGFVKLNVHDLEDIYKLACIEKA